MTDKELRAAPQEGDLQLRLRPARRIHARPLPGFLRNATTDATGSAPPIIVERARGSEYLQQERALAPPARAAKTGGLPRCERESAVSTIATTRQSPSRPRLTRKGDAP